MYFLKLPAVLTIVDEVSRRAREHGIRPSEWLRDYLEQSLLPDQYEKNKHLSWEHRERLSEEVSIVFEPGFTAESFPWARESFFMPYCKRSPSYFRKNRHRLVAYSVDAKGRAIRYWHHKLHDDENMAKSPHIGPIEKVSLADIELGALTHRQVLVFG